MSDEAMIEAMARDVAGRVLQDKVYDEARKRHLNDATQSGFEHHLIRVAVEHGIRIALQPFLAALKQEVRREALEEALMPSGYTKAAYMGEFSFNLTRTDECGDEYVEKVYVPWTTIKEIMAAIHARALSQSGEG